MRGLRRSTVIAAVVAFVVLAACGLNWSSTSLVVEPVAVAVRSSVGSAAPATKQPSALAERVTATGAAAEAAESDSGAGSPTAGAAQVRGDACFKMPNFPLSPLEEEVRRVYRVSHEVMTAMNATYWPTDGTLLGMMRNGRIATDRDVDLQIHATYKTCAAVLQSLRDRFAKLVSLKSFKVVYAKNAKYGKIGRYAMVRMFRKYGTFDTGVDFNCVYTDDPERYTFHVHKGTLEPVPASVYPLGTCRLYTESVPCPRDGYAVLDALKPRYAGCMVFPHCVGNPLVSTKACLSPHPVRPLQEFVDTTQQLERCGYTSLAAHFASTQSCLNILRTDPSFFKCDVKDGEKVCFVQPFKG